MAFVIHWKAPLQPKGFLRIIEIVLAILAFSLTAGFSVENQFKCYTPSQIGNTTVTVKSSYPYRDYDVSSAVDNSTQMSRTEDLNRHYGAGAEFFVAWGVLSMIYAFVAILVYMLITANEDLAAANNILILVDFGLTILWALMWFIASVVWAAESIQLKDKLEKVSSCTLLEDAVGRTFGIDNQTFIQANISIVFGFLNCFVWSCHVWWVLIDTTFYQKWRESRGHHPTSDGL